VNALANEKVGEYVSSHFVAAHKKVGTFQKDGENKNGGNVATYFCLPDETVIHVIPGPVDAETFLREAHWAVDVYESAMMEHSDEPDGVKSYIKLAHAIRYQTDSGRGVPRQTKGTAAANRINVQMPRSFPRGTGALAQAHWLLWSKPMAQLGEIYRAVWTEILGEQVTDVPVIGK
jgi:hypothetical protein